MRRQSPSITHFVDSKKNPPPRIEMGNVGWVATCCLSENEGQVDEFGVDNRDEYFIVDVCPLI